MAKRMNTDFKVLHEEQFVGRNTENIFDDAFWTGLDGVCNALDNMVRSSLENLLSKN